MLGVRGAGCSGFLVFWVLKVLGAGCLGLQGAGCSGWLVFRVFRVFRVLGVQGIQGAGCLEFSVFRVLGSGISLCTQHPAP